MSIQFLGALSGNFIRCPVCGSSRIKPKDYKVHYKIVSEYSSMAEKEYESDTVTLTCGSCGWEKRNSNWKNYLISGKAHSY